MVSYDATYWFELHGEREFLDEFVYSSYMILKSKGYKCLKTSDFNPTIEVGFKKGDVIFGSIQLCEWGFGQSGISIPSYIGYPTESLPFLGRKVDIMTYDEVMKLDPPFFVKPKNEVKRFTGTVIDSDFWKHSILKPYKGCDMFVSEVVDILSEWRVFIHKNKVYGCQFYSGNPLQMLDEFPIGLLLNCLKDMPVSYTLDFGVIQTENGEETVLIEINDMWGTGTYGVDPFNYVCAYVDRWNEIIDEKN